MSKMPVNKKSVVCLETGESFNSLREAADAVGISYQCISRAAKIGVTANGLHFYFAAMRMNRSRMTYSLNISAADIREVNLLSALRPENCLKVQTMRQSPLDAKLPI